MKSWFTEVVLAEVMYVFSIHTPGLLHVVKSEMETKNSPC